MQLPLFVNTLGTKVIAYRDTRALPQATVRHAECSLLLPQSAENDRCETCRNYRKTLNRALNRKSKATTTSTSHTHTNLRYLSSPEKVARLRELQQKHRLDQKRITRLNEKLAELTAKNGVCLDDAMNGDLEKIVKDEDKHVMEMYPKESFLRLFWQQQKEALSKNPKGMRWHPLMIR